MWKLHLHLSHCVPSNGAVRSVDRNAGPLLPRLSEQTEGPCAPRHVTESYPPNEPRGKFGVPQVQKRARQHDPREQWSPSPSPFFPCCCAWITALCGGVEEIIRGRQAPEGMLRVQCGIEGLQLGSTPNQSTHRMCQQAKRGSMCCSFIFPFLFLFFFLINIREQIRSFSLSYLLRVRTRPSASTFSFFLCVPPLLLFSCEGLKGPPEALTRPESLESGIVQRNLLNN
mmetsp:Transcript_54423/g.106486  ORF Transcript_54423/g.106486 Transcript_54423/m.106486 type:complete len:228 (-) Transcript_54423:729-1412(-)